MPDPSVAPPDDGSSVSTVVHANSASTTVSSKAAGKRKAATTEPTESLLHRIAGPSTNKAGLKRDPEEVKRIMYESSKGGAFFKNEERKDEELTAKIHAALRRLDQEIAARGGDLSSEEKKADRILAELESRRDMTQYIVVVDCDAFYASVEELDNPKLKGVAFGVGEGVLTTASYEARKFGCRSAMPGYIARKLCPHIIFVKPDFTKYTAASKKIMDVLKRYDPDMAPASLDEAYMNLTPYIKRTGMTPETAIQQMREEVLQETGLTVSAGCGANTMLAKIAADVNKPNGQCIIAPTAAAAKAFMLDLSVRKIPGIGRVTEQHLEAYGVVRCRDIYAMRGKLYLAFSENNLRWLLRCYLGMGNNVVEKGKREDRRGVGHETTFRTIWRPADLDNKLTEIAESLGDDLKRLKYSGRTITLKLKLETYEVLSRSRTVDGLLFRSADQLYAYGKMLLDAEVAARANAYDAGKPVKGKGRDLRLRLMGLKVSNLIDESDEAVALRKKGGSLQEWTKKAPSRSKARTGKQKSAATAPASGPALASTSKVDTGKAKLATEILIDLTSLDDSDEDVSARDIANDDPARLDEVDEGDEDVEEYDEIFVEAAPCSNCHKTFSFAGDVYNEHVKVCLRPKMELIDLSLSSSQEYGHGIGQAKKFRRSHPEIGDSLNGDAYPQRKTRLGTSSSTKSSSHNSKKIKKSSSTNAFAAIMKQSKKVGSD